MNGLEKEPKLYRMWASILCSRVRLAGTYLEEIASLPIKMRLAKQLIRFEQLARRNALTE
jgi:hypothetical protein